MVEFVKVIAWVILRNFKKALSIQLDKLTHIDIS